MFIFFWVTRSLEQVKTQRTLNTSDNNFFFYKTKTDGQKTMDFHPIFSQVHWKDNVTI